MKALSTRWTESQIELALYLYFQLPFGKLHAGNPEIQKLAVVLGRTNSSVAMKLCNFASLDPKITESGRKGLQGSSAQDKKIWTEFTQDWTANIEESGRIWNSAEDNGDDLKPTLKDNVLPFKFQSYEGPTTAEAVVQRRIGQGFFRRAVLANFGNCILDKAA